MIELAIIYASLAAMLGLAVGYLFDSVVLDDELRWVISIGVFAMMYAWWGDHMWHTFQRHGDVHVFTQAGYWFGVLLSGIAFLAASLRLLFLNALLFLASLSRK